MSKGLEALKRISHAPVFMDKTNAIVQLRNVADYSDDLCAIEKNLKEGEANKNASKILRIIFNAPFIIETLFNKKELGKSATDRYLWGTISEEEVRKVKEFFSDGKI